MRKPDVAYVNGKVYTVDPNFSVATAFCLSDDRFVAVGTDQEIRALCTPETRVVDLHGQVVLPGLIDSHLHINNTGAMKLELNVVAKQRREIVDMVAQAYQTIRPGEWIVGRGWLNDEWPDSSFPTKEELDAVAPDVPVYLKRACRWAASTCASRTGPCWVWSPTRLRTPSTRPSPPTTKSSSRRSCYWPRRASSPPV